MFIEVYLTFSNVFWKENPNLFREVIENLICSSIIQSNSFSPVCKNIDKKKSFFMFYSFLFKKLDFFYQPGPWFYS